MKTILLLALASLGFSAALAAPVPATIDTSFQCPNAAALKTVVANPEPGSVFVAYTPNDPMYKLIEDETTSDITFFGAYIDNGIMKCSYSSTNYLLVLELKPQLANAAFVNPTLRDSIRDSSGNLTPCPANSPEQCQFNVKQ